MKVKGLRVNPLHRSKQTESRSVEDENKTDNDQQKRKKVLFPCKDNFNHIKCKIVRRQKKEKLKREKSKAKRETRKSRLQEGGSKQIPHTIESLREQDETIVQGNLDDEENGEIKEDIGQDEFASYFRQNYQPKVLITYSDNPTKKTRIFGRELTRIIPNSVSLYRNRSGVKKMIKSAVGKAFTDMIVVNENMSQPSILFDYLNLANLVLMMYFKFYS